MGRVEGLVQAREQPEQARGLGSETGCTRLPWALVGPQPAERALLRDHRAEQRLRSVARPCIPDR